MIENNTNEQQVTTKATDAVQALCALSENIHVAASEITRGEFSQSGAGAAGAAFRKIKVASDQDMDDVWGEILSICNKLWENEHIVASIVLIETSSNMFFIPPQMEERVTTSINDANDLRIIKNAEEAFEKGEDDKAVRLASVMQTGLKIKYNTDLSSRIKSRQRTRKTALWISGVSFASLIVITGIGIASAVELLKEPPRPELPQFEDSRRIFQDIFAKDTPQAPSGLKETPNLSTPLATSSPPDAAEETINEESLSPEQEDEIRTPAPPQPDPVVSSDIIFGDPGIQLPEQEQIPDAATDTSLQVLPAPTAETPAESKQQLATRADCVLGYAVIQRAANLVKSQSDVEVANRNLAEFMSTLQSACSRLDIDPMALSLETGMADPERVTEIANTILKKE